jgi:hypothetical protein
MKSKNLWLLALVGYGIYWYYQNKKKPVDASTSAIAPDTSMNTPTVANADVNVRFAIGKLKKFGNVPNTI